MWKCVRIGIGAIREEDGMHVLISVYLHFFHFPAVPKTITSLYCCGASDVYPHYLSPVDFSAAGILFERKIWYDEISAKLSNSFSIRFLLSVIQKWYRWTYICPCITCIISKIEWFWTNVKAVLRSKEHEEEIVSTDEIAISGICQQWCWLMQTRRAASEVVSAQSYFALCAHRNNHPVKVGNFSSILIWLKRQRWTPDV